MKRSHLTLTNVGVLDAGHYRCQVTTKGSGSEINFGPNSLHLTHTLAVQGDVFGYF